MHVTEESIGPLTRDPVCGRQIAKAQALLSAEHHGRSCLFCAERCRMRFALRPDSFTVDGVQPAAREAPALSWRHPRQPEEANVVVAALLAQLAPTPGQRHLSAQDVVAIGELALFDDFGERLLFANGQLVDLRAATRSPDGVLRAPVLPGRIMRDAVGLEVGRRHIGGCRCSFLHLRSRRQQEVGDSHGEA